MRLDKFISQQLEISRAIAHREIRGQRVTVNGEVVRDTAFKLLPDHEVAYDGNVLQMLTGPRYFMLNKPQGYVCSTDDPDHPTILYFIEEPMSFKLHAAGRLDIDTTGLVLLTDDGQWSHRITSPRHHCEKTYRVTLESPIGDDTAAQFIAGVQLHNEKSLTKPAQLEVITPTDVRLTLSEGRYHQVKRMFAAVGNRVIELHRERIGDIALDDDLEPGEYRALSEDEIASIGLPKELQAK
ncbi:16S rRNA pseudouridine(516) synthase RsuA [Pantoea sp. Bo_2]|uniref:16S rRNA pseudouridine(516) synthase RsuA n=1 Tax=unclassified Pantoea TaxID=2630326 RepID=UPI0012325D28|nr:MULTISPECIES: 16S rRNA pseudouridine(516) synthase RsuA [unclassified Pantoea]KAA5949801.1 16S rRNA pseudouridine(516) synthase RsuA [Pantoea sp. VH_3]KAA5954028.1 16S rRNA pseudouridine(516) synthase RsuA [Pantoea sp. VH_25]KAA5960891.1 16S rRNA pseudouridine(516) synthase RsuA [Pantoea sp. VH_24]KAA5964569.1 16S rRNA pseudouridine(516) synthase RsuA [Pantoea sp. VH_16]KAA5968494.1 16S rRNA pseudouridine(516) synthase RsuA [Pantoea sp. VH_18]